MINEIIKNCKKKKLQENHNFTPSLNSQVKNSKEKKILARPKQFAQLAVSANVAVATEFMAIYLKVHINTTFQPLLRTESAGIIKQLYLFNNEAHYSNKTSQLPTTLGLQTWGHPCQAN